jgi:CheY-like chemotaxis protein
VESAVQVLVVDDNALIRKMVRAVLESESIVCLEAATASEALIALNENPVDVCFLDQNLPDADGLTVLQLLYAPGGPANRPKVYLVTGSDEEGLSARALDLGAVGVLAKPLSPDILLRKVRGA